MLNFLPVLLSGSFSKAPELCLVCLLSFFPSDVCFFCPLNHSSLSIMPLHKSSRGSRLDPTMISAPLGDFRHTMHIGRGGDVFGDTSFLSTVGPSPTTSESPVENELQSSDSMSSLTMDLDLDLDLGPSMLGDVLGVMDGLSVDSDKENVFGPQSDAFTVETKQGRRVTERSLNVSVERLTNFCKSVFKQPQFGQIEVNSDWIDVLMAR
uniref:CDC42 effector protein (Rho GTPase binding) 5 n=1 Tax=Nothobranchius furzeri TaxID=105023 RepID=A0A8C6MCN0_NOTFU